MRKWRETRRFRPERCSDRVRRSEGTQQGFTREHVDARWQTAAGVRDETVGTMKLGRHSGPWIKAFQGRLIAQHTDPETI